MRAAQSAIKSIYRAFYCSLHFHVSKEATVAVHDGVLGYENNSVAETMLMMKMHLIWYAVLTSQSNKKLGTKQRTKRLSYASF